MRLFRDPRCLNGQVGHLKREHSGTLSLGQLHTGNEDDRTGEQFHPIT